MINWQRKKLAEVVVQWIKGSTPSRARKEYYSLKPDIPFARVTDLHGGVLYKTEMYLTELGAENIKNWVPKGAVLLSVSGTIGKTAVAGAPMKINQAIQAMVFDESIVLADYAYYYFQFFKPWLDAKANTVTIPNLTKSQMENTFILFPCLEEQTCIVEIMKRAEGLQQKQQSALEEVENILYSTIDREIRKSIKTMSRLGDYCTEPVLPGIIIKSEGESPNNDYIKTIHSKDWSLTKADKYDKIYFDDLDQKQYNLKRGDILVRRNKIDKSECCLLIMEDLENVIWGVNIARIRINEKKLRPAFLLAWIHFRSKWMYNDRKLDSAAIKNIPIPVLPMTVQEKLEKVVLKVLKIRDKLDEIDKKMEWFYKSILGYSFTGSLTTNYRRFHSLEDPEELFISNHYYAKDLGALYDEASVKTVIWRELFRNRQIEIIKYLSDFQKEILRVYAEAEAPLPIHRMLKQIKEKNRIKHKDYSIQDAIAAVKLLEGLGYLTELVPEKIYINKIEMKDSYENPITIQKYQINPKS